MPQSVIPHDATPEQIEARIDELLGELRADEKVDMLSGHGFLEQVEQDGRYCARMYHIGAGNERLGIPPLLFNDGPRGVAMGRSTCFPVPMARGASFDVDLERRIGDAIGREMRAHGGNLFGGVCINLLRHPAWGRAQETYGEDPVLLGEMGAALTRGVQHHNVIATAKHFAANSMENARFHVDVSLDARALREVYTPHFRRCVDAGAGAIMSAYNQVNGAYCGHNPALLIDLLKDEWGFDGFVYSDFVMGCRGVDAFNAGLDVEAPDTIHYGDHLLAAAEGGEVPPERLDDGVRRVLRSLLRTLARLDPETYSKASIACAEHVALAREAADKSIVLLRNEGALPWNPREVRRVLVIGALADRENLGDHGSSRVYPPEVVTPLAGLRAASGEMEIVHDTGEDHARVAQLADDADAVLVVAGYTHRDEGEFIPGAMSGTGEAIGGDRLDLTLGEDQENLILAAAEANPNVTVAIMSGSAVLMERWRARVRGILMLWYPGMQGGAALADVLLGRVNPSGRLPFSIPKDAADLPPFDRDAKAITYDLWHGYTKHDREGVEPAFPFGFGLGYTEYLYGTPSVTLDRSAAELAVDVEAVNAGDLTGETVIQVYAGRAEPADAQPLRRLVGFARIELPPALKRSVSLRVPLRDLAHYEPESGGWKLSGGEWRIWAGGSSDERTLRDASITLDERSFAR